MATRRRKGREGQTIAIITTGINKGIWYWIHVLWSDISVERSNKVRLYYYYGILFCNLLFIIYYYNILCKWCFFLVVKCFVVLFVYVVCADWTSHYFWENCSITLSQRTMKRWLLLSIQIVLFLIIVEWNLLTRINHRSKYF